MPDSDEKVDPGPPDPEREASSQLPEDWPRNYFNYFTEIEDHFQRARGTGLFLLSPLDWALIETWRQAGVPLEAVLKGVTDAFEKWHSRKQKRRMVNSLAYCAQAVMEQAGRTPAQRDHGAVDPQDLFEVQQIVTHLRGAAASLQARTEPALHEVARTLECLAEHAPTHVRNLEELEQRLTASEEKIVAVLRSGESDESLFSIRRSLEAELKPYRSKMTSDQLSTLERRYLESALLERAKLPRLSLFYLR